MSGESRFKGSSSWRELEIGAGRKSHNSNRRARAPIFSAAAPCERESPRRCFQFQLCSPCATLARRLDRAIPLPAGFYIDRRIGAPCDPGSERNLLLSAAIRTSLPHRRRRHDGPSVCLMGPLVWARPRESLRRLCTNSCLPRQSQRDALGKTLNAGVQMCVCVCASESRCSRDYNGASREIISASRRASRKRDLSVLIDGSRRLGPTLAPSSLRDSPAISAGGRLT